MIRKGLFKFPFNSLADYPEYPLTNPFFTGSVILSPICRAAI